MGKRQEEEASPDYKSHLKGVKSPQKWKKRGGKEKQERRRGGGEEGGFAQPPPHLLSQKCLEKGLFFPCFVLVVV